MVLRPTNTVAMTEVNGTANPAENGGGIGNEKADAPRAVCQFCGRAGCAEHIQKRRFVTGFTSAGGLRSFKDNAVSVEDAVWCGMCHPYGFTFS
jgi:hypothetical protein